MKNLTVKLADMDLNIPYLSFKGGEGKTAIISGGIHGDEVNGIMLVKKLIDYFIEKNIEKDLAGEIIILPLVNKSGFDRQSRVTGLDRRDLNRAFNRKSRSKSNLLANALEKEFYSRGDIAIDCHDSGKRNILLPHTRVHRFEDKYCTEVIRDMAKAFGSKIIVERKGKRGMLAVEMTKKYRLPVLTIEVGGAMKVEDKFLNKSLEGIINVLRQQNFLPGDETYPRKQYYLRDRYGIQAHNSGIIKFDKKLGQRVHMGDKIGTIYIPSKHKTKELIAPMCGIIFSIHHFDLIKKGEILFSILEDKKCHKKRRMTAGLFEEIVNIKM